jgi:isoquinoline 1-oxidoreductase beta subunit
VLDDSLLVIGDHMWARSAVSTPEHCMESAAHAAVETTEIWKQLRAASNQEGAVAKSVGDIGRD